MKIRNISQKTIIAEDAVLADTPLARMVGLLNHDDLPAGEALVITQCRSIHMFFMRFAIDVIFVDRKNQVVGLVRAIKPFRLSPYFLQASYAIELPVGMIDESRTVLGDEVLLEGNEIKGFANS